MRDWSELTAALDEESNRRYIAMTCDTEDAEAERAYLHFAEQIEPQIKLRQFTLERHLLTHLCRANLPQPRSTVLLRDAANRVELFREENVPLETEETRLGQQYQKRVGSLSVTFRGVEHTLVQMDKYLEEPDRAVRQGAWELMAQRRLQERAYFDALFEQSLEVRERIARNAEFANYRDYAFRRLGRFDYTPADCVAFHEAVIAEVVPRLRLLQAERRRCLGVETLHPWDLNVDPLTRPPLRPFARVEDLVERTQRIFDRLDPELASGFRQMQELRLLDLANRKGKAPGGYQATLAEARLPFIFMNAVGLQRDVETILHEAGHAFHALATRSEDLYAYRNPPIEICEVASMSMELLGLEEIGTFYSDGDAWRARRTHLETIIQILAWIATVDAFQHWLYTHPGHGRAERAAAWNHLMDCFEGDVDWTGYEEARAHAWHRQLHIFLHPFYYIEYGIAQLGALQVWARANRDRAAALTDYNRALALGGSQPLPELFAAAGCAFRFDAATIRLLLELLEREIQALPLGPPQVLSAGA